MNKTKELTKRVRLTEKEFKQIMKNAAKKNMKFSAYVRYMTLSQGNYDPEKVKAICELTSEVNRIGHNINQIVKNNNSGLYSEMDKLRLTEYMRIINEKVGRLLEKK